MQRNKIKVLPTSKKILPVVLNAQAQQRVVTVVETPPIASNKQHFRCVS